jgi:uncharacterized repeat protein (TIGR03806 family)
MPGGADNPYYVMEKGGRILRLPADFSLSASTLFLDLREVVETGGEGGVFSMAFHPQYPEQPYVYVSHMVDDEGFFTRISRFTSVDGLRATDEKILFNLPQNLSPYGRGSIHNAGTLAFGPDGYLYMSVGDDKRTFDVGVTDQLYGSIIRVDVDTEDAYAIPDTNPFGNEIFAYGFRNPWRISFDKLTGELWTGDVGEQCFEEVNRVEIGRNYGWPNWEADVCGPGKCGGENTLPVHQYHTGKECGPGNSITGGYVYRGGLNPALSGKYIYGDYQTGQVWAFDIKNGFNEDLFVDSRSDGIASFGEDNQGEIFHLDIVTGAISRIEPRSGEDAVAGPPATLSATGCFTGLSATLVPAEGVLPYDIAQPFWSDGAEKQRFLSLPENTAFTIDEEGDWELPAGGVLIKHFRLANTNVETRFFVRYQNGAYGAYTYKWTAEGDAELVDAGGEDVALADGQLWRLPSRNECRQCHTARAGYILGPETRQMNIQRRYSQTGRTANQFATLAAFGMVKGDLTSWPAFPGLDDVGVDIHQRASSYIHVNCSSCHRGSGGSQSIWDARYTTSLAEKGLCLTEPVTPVTDLQPEYYVSPGDHLSSSIWWRVHTRGTEQMPPIGSNRVDTAGATLLAEWIDGLSAADCE